MNRLVPADDRRAMRRTGHKTTLASDNGSGDPFERVVDRMKLQYSIRIKKWRRNMSGCAWRVYHANGKAVNWVESPLPRTPISLAIFLHEVGHHVIGFDRYKKRCEEEYHVWVWALEQMKALGIEPDEKVNRRFQLSMEYAVNKAVRRGIKSLPEPLAQFLPQAA